MYSIIEILCLQVERGPSNQMFPQGLRNVKSIDKKKNKRKPKTDSKVNSFVFEKKLNYCIRLLMIFKNPKPGLNSAHQDVGSIKIG